MELTFERADDTQRCFTKFDTKRYCNGRSNNKMMLNCGVVGEFMANILELDDCPESVELNNYILRNKILLTS